MQNHVEPNNKKQLLSNNKHIVFESLGITAITLGVAFLIDEALGKAQDPLADYVVVLEENTAQSHQPRQPSVNPVNNHITQKDIVSEQQITNPTLIVDANNHVDANNLSLKKIQKDLDDLNKEVEKIMRSEKQTDQHDYSITRNDEPIMAQAPTDIVTLPKRPQQEPAEDAQIDLTQQNIYQTRTETNSQNEGTSNEEDTASASSFFNSPLGYLTGAGIAGVGAVLGASLSTASSSGEADLTNPPVNNKVADTLQADSGIYMGTWSDIDELAPTYTVSEHEITVIISDIDTRLLDAFTEDFDVNSPYDVHGISHTITNISMDMDGEKIITEHTLDAGNAVATPNYDNSKYTVDLIYTLDTRGLFDNNKSLTFVTTNGSGQDHMNTRVSAIIYGQEVLTAKAETEVSIHDLLTKAYSSSDVNEDKILEESDQFTEEEIKTINAAFKNNMTLHDMIESISTKIIKRPYETDTEKVEEVEVEVEVDSNVNLDMNSYKEMNHLASLLQNVETTVAPDFMLEDVFGDKYSLYENFLDDGKPVIMEFYATWCPYCQDLHDTTLLSLLAEEYADEVAVMMIEASTNSDYDDLIEFFEGNMEGHSEYIFETTSLNPLFGVEYFPSVYAVSSSGEMLDISLVIKDFNDHNELYQELMAYEYAYGNIGGTEEEHTTEDSGLPATNHSEDATQQQMTDLQLEDLIKLIAEKADNYIDTQAEPAVDDSSATPVYTDSSLESNYNDTDSKLDMACGYEAETKGCQVPDASDEQESIPNKCGTGIIYEGTKTVTDFTLTDIEDSTHNLAELMATGKQVLFNFFSTDCSHCLDGYKYDTSMTQIIDKYPDVVLYNIEMNKETPLDHISSGYNGFDWRDAHDGKNSFVFNLTDDEIDSLSAYTSIEELKTCGWPGAYIINDRFEMKGIDRYSVTTDELYQELIKHAEQFVPQENNDENSSCGDDISCQTQTDTTYDLKHFKPLVDAGTQNAPEFKLTDLDGNEVDLYADYLEKGKPVVLEFLATWCGHCQSFAETGMLTDLAENYNEEIQVLMIEASEYSTHEDLKTFMADYGLGDNEIFFETTELNTDYELEYFPTLYLINTNGAMIEWSSMRNQFNDVEELVEEIYAFEQIYPGMGLTSDGETITEVDAELEANMEEYTNTIWTEYDESTQNLSVYANLDEPTCGFQMLVPGYEIKDIGEGMAEQNGYQHAFNGEMVLAYSMTMLPMHPENDLLTTLKLQAKDETVEGPYLTEILMAGCEEYTEALPVDNLSDDDYML